MTNNAPSTHFVRAAVALAALVALAACGDKPEAAVRVNNTDIPAPLVDLLVQQRGLKGDQAEAASRQIVERLINEQLALQKASDMKLDREPRIALALEAARREVLARAYAERVGEAASKPTAADVKQFYEAKPALFKQRRIYNIQEILIECKPDQVQVLREKLAASTNVNAFLDYLRANDFRYQGSQATRAAEQLPAVALDGFSKMKDGSAAVLASTTGAQVLVLAGSRDQPLTEDQAKPVIEQILTTERKRKLIEEDLKTLRAGAKIEYANRFSQAASGAAAPAVPASK
ncbi:MAG: peptidyl-prolyl cis-trans isomerase, EpsD family [Burkholderiales bacterium]|nr:peptidyl-prolyl cis-trans isomerase, EpsD family [Burkholderiales bacterium]